MDVVVTYLGVIFGCGLVARFVKMPPLIGFVAAGFILNAAGVPQLQELSLMSEIGVTLMLFAIGLRLDLRTLLGKQVWLTAGVHMLLMTVIGAAFLAGLSALGAFGPESLRVLAVVALVLSFSSTIFVVKILQDRGDEQAFYGNICIGVLILQDIAAVAVISVSRGEAPSIFSLGLVILIPLLAWLTKDWYRLGHGEMGALFGIAMALIPGYALFERLGLSGSLGALVMGLVLAPRPGSDQLSHTLFTVKELLLVGFFVSIGFQGLPTLENVRVGLLLVGLLPIQAVLYWFLLWLIGLRNRTNVLASLLLSNYSEFALIVAAMGVSAGWLSPHWLLSLVIAVSAGFIVSSLANPYSVSGMSRLAQKLPARPPHKIHPEDRPIDIGEANAIVLGMGRVGRATCAQLQDEHGYKVLGVEHDKSRVHGLRQQGFKVIEGDATDYDFWTRVVRNGLVEIIVLAMPSQHANIEALRELRQIGYQKGTVAAVALYREDVEELEKLGLDVVVHLYAGAGEALADRAVEALASHRTEGPG
jgi:predicted Kef-type K+ transport protein